MYNQTEEDYYMNEVKNMEIFKQQYSNEIYEWKYVDCNILSINDIIIIEFLPFSQKYIYSLYPIFGKITKIDQSSDNNDEILNTIELFDNNNIKYPHFGVSFFGDTNGYAYSVQKLFKKINS